MQRLLNDTEPSAVDKESISDVLSPGRLKNMLGFFFYIHGQFRAAGGSKQTDGRYDEERNSP